MDITGIVTTEYETIDEAERVSKLLGAFAEQERRVLVVTSDGDFSGVVTHRQLLASRHAPDERVRNVMRDDPPRVSRTEDVRETARLMVESQLKLLPVFEGDQFDGVVTARGIAEAVRSNLDALEVADVYTQDLVTANPDTTLGEVLHRIREHGISRLPVINEASTGGGVTREALGMVSIYDLLAFILRETTQEKGGDSGGFDFHGGEGSFPKFRTHGGYGERAGFEARLLDLPARNVMNVPVATVSFDASLGDATAEMLDKQYASLVVVDETDQPAGIVTLTDVLRSLTWTETESIRIQIFGIDLLTGVSRRDVAEMIEAVDEKYADMDVIEAYVILHQHKETLRGMPLIRTTIRLFTDRGRFSGTGEAYGAAPSIREARDHLERAVLDDKEHAQTRARSDRDREAQEKLLGWWLEA
ncbi:CBS domain-containing protein [Halorientalis brevis]|uniref:CBS domain-containing protein n=1 Tax=Halorientalis brevis TaxID=1126241 RepID=A0ABD6CCZ5_9EURY|nr:CBS domain-containing protein [Halorientalis brevis]